MKGMSLLTLKEFNQQQIEELLWTAVDMKALIKQKKSTELTDLLKGQSIAEIFEKRSTRTRFAFEAGAHCLGAHAILCNKDDIHLGVSDTLKDTAHVLSGLSELIAARVFEHEHLNEILKYSKVPVVNALSDRHHPIQALADLMTIYEHFGVLKGLKVAWVGDGNNVLNSLLIACTKMKMHFASSTPVGYAPCVETLSYAEKMADINGTQILVTTSPEEAVRNADVIITDTWISVGMEEESAKRLEAFEGELGWIVFEYCKS
jgi:ornithine carbamoyltransferase